MSLFGNFLIFVSFNSVVDLQASLEGLQSCFQILEVQNTWLCNPQSVHIRTCIWSHASLTQQIKPSPDLMIKFYLQQEDRAQQRGGSEDVMPPPCRKNTKWSPRSRALSRVQMQARMHCNEGQLVLLHVLYKIQFNIHLCVCGQNGLTYKVSQKKLV